MTDDNKIRSAFQGCLGAFSHRAAEIFSERVDWSEHSEAVSCQSFDEVFDNLEKGHVDFGVLPLENSSVGSIVANFDLLWRQPVVIVSEVYLPVHHNLIGFPGTKLEEIEEIYSHPVALGQVRKFLATLPNAKAISFWDTAGSVVHVKELGRKNVAAIAGQPAARVHGLSILAEHVEDHGGNNTRFGVVVPGSSEGVIDARSRPIVKEIAEKLLAAPVPVKLTIAVELINKPGSLAKLLAGIAFLGVNLTKIESRPIPETPWHYRFFLDIEIDRPERSDEVIQEVAALSGSIKILGIYPASTQEEKVGLSSLN